MRQDAFATTCSLVLILLAVALAGCKTMPKDPEGILWHHDKPRAEAIGFSLDKTDDTVHVTPMDETDKWPMLDPDTWDDVQRYRDELKVYIEDLNEDLRRCRGR